MDLGNIITQLGSAYITARYGQARQPAIVPGGYDPAARPVMVQPVDTFGVQPAFGPLIAGGRAVAGYVGRMSTADKIGTAIGALGLGLAADEIAEIAAAASKVKCRRKRRRLATHSDIKDLAALKAVLGTGKAFDTWIATRKM